MDTPANSTPANTTPANTTMWEAVAVQGRLDELLGWVQERIAPAADLYRSADHEPRLVVIDPTGGAAEALAEVPDELVERPPHAWDFERI